MPPTTSKCATTRYFFKRGSIWHYRRRVPSHLAELVGADTWWEHLGNSEGVARRRCAVLTAQHDRLSSPSIAWLIRQEGGAAQVSAALTAFAVYPAHPVPPLDAGALRRLSPAEAQDDLDWHAILMVHHDDAVAEEERLAPLVAALTTTIEPVRTFSLTVDDWLKDTKPSTGTRGIYERNTRRFVEVCGDLPLSAINQDSVALLLKAVSALPRFSGLPASMRGATVPALLQWREAHPDSLPVLPAAVQSALGCLNSFFTWCCKPAQRYMITNPAAGFEAPKDPRGKDPQHHRALDWHAAPAFYAALRPHTEVAGMVLRFLMLTAARIEEVQGARWAEINLVARRWNIPAGRMKARKVHRVALSVEAIDLLNEMPRAGDLVFPGMKRNTVRQFMARALPEFDTVPHGLRSAFKGWAVNASKDHYATELALAHSVGTAVAQAYLRDDLLAVRAQLMSDWAAFCTSVAGSL